MNQILFNLKDFRKNHLDGMSQEEFGRIIGMDQEHVSRLENNPLNMKVKTLLLISEKFGLSLESLLVHDSYKTKGILFNLKDFRKNHLDGMSQEEFGRILNVSHDRISRLESNPLSVDVKTILRISDKFGLTFEEILGKVPKRVSGIDISVRCIYNRVKEKNKIMSNKSLPLAYSDIFYKNLYVDLVDRDCSITDDIKLGLKFVLSKLTLLQRRILILRYEYGFTYDEIIKAIPSLHIKSSSYLSICIKEILHKIKNTSYAINGYNYTIKYIDSLPNKTVTIDGKTTELRNLPIEYLELELSSRDYSLIYDKCRENNIKSICDVIDFGLDNLIVDNCAAKTRIKAAILKSNISHIIL